MENDVKGCQKDKCCGKCQHSKQAETLDKIPVAENQLEKHHDVLYLADE